MDETNLSPDEPEDLYWHWVECVFKSEVTERPRKHELWERNILLVQATSIENAWELGAEVAKSKEHSYAVESGEILSWRFVKIEKVGETFEKTIVNGTEVYSRFFRRKR
jgi:hypothetical protein